MPQGVTFSGLGSGLDTDSIIQQLIGIERRPIQLIQRRQARLEVQKEVYQSINTGLLSLKGAADNLVDDDLFSIVKATSDDTARVTVSATNEASAGTFTVEVVDKAQARSLSSSSFGSLDDALNLSGEFVVNGEGIEIEEGNSLLDIRDAINDADAGINAQILTVSSGDNRLILTAETVGAKGFDIKDSSATNVLQSLGLTSSDVSIKNGFANGGRSAQFLASDQAIGTLLNLSSSPTGTVTIGDQQVDLDLTSDSLDDIRDKINAAAPTGVTASVVSSNVGGLTRYQLEIEGTTTLADSSGVLEALGTLDSGGNISDKIITGTESDQFNSTTTAVGALLGLGSAPSGTVTIGGESLALDLAADSLADIQTKINGLGISGVNATITSDSDEEDNALFSLRIDGTTDVTDDGNVLETLGIVLGSNSTFGSVAQVLTGNVANQERGAIKNSLANGAASDELSSNSDAVGTLIGSSASGAVSVGDKTVSIDLASDSLNDIRDKINAAAPTGVTALVNATGPATFELQVSGTTDFEDDSGVLEALGVLEASSDLSADTTFAEIVGAGVQAGDSISISGTNHDGDLIAGTFTISSGSNKVQNLLDTVEQVFGGNVTASVDNEGRIVLSDDQAGSSELSLSLLANNEGGGSLDFGTSTLTTQGTASRSAELQAGQDATVRINGIALSRDSNTITDAVQGVTLNLLEAEEGKLVNIAVTRDDTTELRRNIESFVEEFNAAINLIDGQLAIDPNSQEGGPLSGDATLLSLQTRIRSAVTSQVDGLEEGFSALVLIGISFDRSGKLSVDDERLTEVLAENLDDVRKLFVAQGNASDAGVEFISSNKNTKAGEFAVEVSQAAQKASLIGSIDLSGGLAEDQTLTITDKATGQPAVIELKAGDTTDDIVDKINTSVASDVAEVRRGSIANTTDGTAAITADTAFAGIFGAGVAAGDTIRINGTTHGGSSITETFTIDDPDNQTVGDLLTSVRRMFDGKVSATVDAEGRIVVTDNQVGPSSLTVTLIEENEGGGNLNFGSIDVEVEGRLSIEVTASNEDGKLTLEHSGFGARNGFSIEQSVDQLGIAAGASDGTDVEGTINGEEADGFGRILSGKIGSETVEGLSLRVSLTQEEVDSSDAERGNVSLIFGIARQLSGTLDFITDSFDGTIQNREKAINDTIDDLGDQVVSMERRVEQTRLNLVGKFAALEGTLATMQSQGNFLTSQLAGLST